MKTLIILTLFLSFGLLSRCQKLDEVGDTNQTSGLSISPRSTLKVQINTDVETIVLSKLKNPSDATQLSIQDKLDLIPTKTRNGFKASLYEDGTIDTEMTILDPGGMTGPRDDVPPSDIPKVHKLVSSGNFARMYDINEVEIINGPADQSSMSRYVLDVIDRVLNGYPDILTYAHYIDSLPGGEVIQLNSRFIRVNYSVPG